MQKYLVKVKEELEKIQHYEGLYILHAENYHTDTFAKLAISKDAELLCVIPVRVILEPSIYAREVVDVETKKY